MSELNGYLRKCLKFRYLAANLVGSDLRARFRRSHVGILWAIIQPLVLASLFGYVLAVMFKQPFKEQCAYVYSGVVAWELFAQSLSAGSGALVNAEGFLRQSKIPLLIFQIRQAIVNLIIAFFGFVGFFIFCLLAYPEIINLKWVMIVPWFFIAAFLTTPIIVISSIVNTLFRDYQQAIGLGLQALWYVSPAFIPRSVFEHGVLATWSAFNPVTALLDLIRDPLLYNRIWEVNDLVCVFIWIIAVSILAIFLIRKYENKIIYSF